MNIMHQTLPIMISISTFILIFAVIPFLRIKSDRRHHDPLPMKIRIIWPIVNFLDMLISKAGNHFIHHRYFNLLQQSGLIFMITPAQFLAIKIIVSTLTMGSYFLITIFIFQDRNPAVAICATWIGFLIPNLWIKNESSKRALLIIRDLPNFLEYLQIAMVAGLNLSGALNQAVKKGPAGPLKQEFVRVIRDMRAGKSRIEALKLSAERIAVRDYSTLVQAIVQSELSGSSLGETLKAQAEQRRSERFLRAEKIALEAPVKLLFPLVIFIFPVSFLILTFPVIIKFMYEI